jgi:predicted phosphodiesterase
MLRILHVSDLHFPSRDETVAQVLQDAISQRQPNVLLVTGDVVDHPSPASMFGKGHWIAARNWLKEVERAVRDKVGASPTIIVCPGNHDLLFSGLTGWCWPANRLFNRVFGEWRRPPVFHVADANLTLLTLDTNRRGAWFSAEGKAIRARLTRLKRQMERHPDAGRIRSSTKILLMHHHPLPVPFQGTDWLLHTRRVDRLLQFVAENRIDLILHGHKHNATWSHLRVGGTSVEAFFLEVLGAGSAMKKDDRDPRGHNFNLIDLAPSGVRQVRQFFKGPGADRFVESKASRAEEAVSRLIQFQFRQPYRVHRLTWRLHADEEGDGRNELLFEGLVFNRSLDAYEVLLPRDDLETGQALPYQLRSSPAEFGARLAEREINGSARTFLSFTQQPRAEPSLSVEVENYTLNSYAMNRREAAERGQADIERDCLDMLLTNPVEELCLEAEFPSTFRFETVRLEVLEPLEHPDVVHEDLTREFRTSVMPAAPNQVRARLKLPPPNYRYRLSWELPLVEEPPDFNFAHSRRSQFEEHYLGLVDAAYFGALADRESRAKKEAVQNAIVEAFQDLSSALEPRIRRAVSAAAMPRILTEQTADLSIMVCDRPSGGPPRLRLVFWNRRSDYQYLFDTFRLSIGDGNAGRAYKTGTVRLFDKRAAQGNPKVNTYRKEKGAPEHEFLLSIPLLDPLSGFPLAVLNAGTSSVRHADLMRALTEEDVSDLASTMHQQPLERLLKAAGLNPGYNEFEAEP